MSTETSGQAKPTRAHFFRPVTWPFEGGKELPRMWWLILVDFVPILNVLVFRGWRLACVRRVALHEDPIAPEPRDILTFIGHGFVLWATTAVYLVIPTALIWGLGIGGLPDLIDDARRLPEIASSGSVEMMAGFVKEEFVEQVIAAALPLVWLPIAALIYRASMIRCAVTGRLRSLFNIPAAIALLFRFPGKFIYVYFMIFLVMFLVVLTGNLLSATIIVPLLLLLILVPLYYWMTAALYGTVAEALAQKIAQKNATALEAGSQVSAT